MSINPQSVFTVVQPTTPLADPHVLSDIRDRRSIIDAIYDSLIRRDEHGSFIPWVARSWSHNNTNTHWIFNLRPNIKFHNHEWLSAKDVVGSINRAISPELPGELGTQGVLRSYLADAKIAVLDELTIEIHLGKPFADLLDLIVDIPIVPEAMLAELPEKAIGSGPYRLLSAESGKIELVAFTDHWAGRPPVEKLIWLAESSPQTRQSLVLSGQADIAVDVPSTKVNDDSTGFIEQPSYLCIIFLFNLLNGPGADIRVRQALNFAIDIEEILADKKIINSAAEPLAGPLTSKHFGGTPLNSPYTYDPTRAKALLKEAGYSNGLSIQFDLPARFPDEAIALATKIAEQLGNIGVAVTLNIHDNRPGYSEFVRTKQFVHLACFDSSPASIWRVYKEKLDSRVQGPWWQGYHSDQFNNLLDQAAQSLDDEQRNELLKEAFSIVQRDAPWLFLYAPYHQWLLSHKAKGWTPTIEGRVRIV
jgi:peptide/nickel transport system substrate-binding protein